MGENNYQLLIKKLDEFIRKYYVNQLIRGGILFFSFALIFFLAAVLIEYFGQFGTEVRTTLFFGGCTVLLVSFTFWLIVPLSKLIAIGKRISHEKAAQIVGTHFSKIDDKLFNILQLNYIEPDGSSDLIKASINQKIKELNPFRFSLAVNFSENKRYLKYFMVPTIILLGLIAFKPKIITESTDRLVDYSSSYSPQAPYIIQVENEHLNAFKNEDFRLTVKLNGSEIPSDLNIIYSGSRYLMRKVDKNKFSYTFKNIQENIPFFFYDEEFESERFELKLLPKPLLMDLSVQMKFPAYLNQKDQIIEGTGDLSVPEGTHLKWIFNTENTGKLLFIAEDTSELLVQSGENEFLYSRRVYDSFIYGLSNANRYLKFTDTVFYTLSVVPDLSPFIEVDVKNDSLNPKVLYFKGLIKDDYGFSKLVFHSKFVGAKDSLGQLESEPIPIDPSLSQNLFYHNWNLSAFDLDAGDQIEYYFEVWDNDGVNGAKSSRTKKMVFKAPTKQELKEKNRENNKDVKNDLKESIALTKEIKKDLESLKEKLVNKKKLGFQEKKQLESLLEKQEQVKQTMKALEQRNKENNKLQQEYDPLDQALLEKQQQLQEMFEKVMTEEMKEMMEEMQKMMEKLQKDKLQNSLEKMELSNDDIMKEMERNLELFKQLELEKELAEAKEKIDELKEKQAELKEESLSDGKKDEKKAPQELKKEQDKLNNEFDELSEKLDDIQKKNQDLERPNKLEDTKPLEEDIKKDMKKSSEELSNKNKKKASESQKKSEKKMEELSDKINAMQMQSQTSMENLEDLRALLENLIQLSFDQERVMQKLKGINQNDPSYVKLAQEQKKLKDDAKIIEDSLFALSKRVIQIESIVNKEMGKVNYNMEKAIEQLQERRTPVASSRQQHSMTSINNLALLLDEAIQQMQMQLMNGSGGGKCQKPGGSSNKPSESMKNAQKKLNEQMKALKDAMKKGQGQKPGEGQGGKNGQKNGLSKELAQMAAKQAAIRQAIKELQEQIGEGKSGKAGSLQKLQEMMEETETELVNKKITNQTLLRQEKILTRLLESEKAEKEREKEEKRESIEFANEISRNQKIFLEYNRQKERELELLKTVPPSFKKFYKTKVSEYFNQLEK